MSVTVLLVEDDETTADAMHVGLTAAGYRSVVASTGREALAAVEYADPSLIVLDLGLPDIDGLHLCRRFRRDVADRPIIIVTGRDADVDVVVGLDAGADDYVCKPFSTAVLVARVRAHLRSRARPDGTIIVAGLRLDHAAHVVTFDGTVIELRPREFALLELLMRQAGRVVTRHDLLGALWGEGWDLSCNRALDVHVVSLRRRLGDNVDDPRWIHTVRGIGYRFAAR